jgi:hypothetical protein
MDTSTRPPERTRGVLAWALVFGAVGFGCGFFGPIALNPSANQGPLMGIFITGPGGVVLGLLLATLLSARRFTPVRERALSALAFAWGAGILVACLPGPEWRGDVIDGQVSACEEPSRKLAESIARWEQSIARVDWAEPRPGWRRDARAMLEREGGFVVTVAVARTLRIEELQKPWNRGRLVARAWSPSGDTREYWARGTSCDEWIAAGRSLWFPTSQMSRAWPADRLPNFLGLQELGPVPDAYRALVPRG